MTLGHAHTRPATAGAEQVASAAADLRHSLREPHALDTLPLTLANLESGIDELATCMVVLAQVVAESADQPETTLDLDHLPPEARALCWHLHEFAARLRAARAAGTTAREWAEELPPAPGDGAVMAPKVHA
jgi:hypothetical protein